MIVKKISKQKLLTIATGIVLVGAIGFFLTCFPLFGNTPLSLIFSESSTPAYGEGMNFGWALGGFMFCNYLFPFLFFFGTGLIYMVILVMFQDSIDYNEYQFGERKESVISAWRPLDVKLGSALLRGFQYLIFLSAGVMGVVNGISTAEGSLNSGEYTSEQFVNKISELMDGVTSQSLVIIGIWIVIILVACFIAVWLLIHFGYKIDEKRHQEIVAELEKRHAASGFDSSELEQKQPAAAE